MSYLWMIILDNRYTWVYLMKQKHSVYDIYVSFARMVETQFPAKIKIFKCNSDGEYTSTCFCNFPSQQETIPQLSCPHTLEQNGVAEHKHRHLVDTVRFLLHSSHVPLKFWRKALLTAPYLINLSH